MSCKIHISFGIGIIQTIQLSDEDGLREPKKTFDGKGGSHKGYCIHDVEIQLSSETALRWAVQFGHEEYC